MNIIRNPLQRVYRAGEAIFWPRKKQTITPPVQLIYSYETPASGAAPAPGSIVHADNLLNKLAVNHLDLNANDITANVGQITTGDKVAIGPTVYDVIAPTVLDGSGLFSYITIDPATQRQPGVYPVKAWR